ncbi:MAG: hypothetical protein WBH85_10550 [Thermoanaerobaculia bacterium]
MKVRLRSVSQVLVGLDRVGLAGLEQVFERADDSGLGEREELVGLMMEALSTRNYIPAESEDEYRKTVWREYLRHRGEDIRHLYSKVEIVVRGEAGDDLDRIVGAVSAAMTEHELEPRFLYEPPDPAGVNPQVSIAGHVVVRGARSESAIRKAIKAQMDDW